MFSKARNIITRFSLTALLGVAHGAHFNGKLSKSYSSCIEGLTRSTTKCNSWMWSEFFTVAVEVGLKLKEESVFKELSAIATADECPDYDKDASKPLLRLSMWGCGLGFNEASFELVERAILADSENADAWFFSGWSVLCTNEQEAEKRLKRSVELDPAMASRIQEDERCQKNLSQNSIAKFTLSGKK